MAKRVLLSVCIVLLGYTYVCAQSVAYKLMESEHISSSIVKLTLMVYGKSKKTIDADAQYAAVRAVLFEGCPNTAYKNPLLDDGEATSFEQFPNYFYNLYNNRLSDFVLSSSALSKFKCGDKLKGTLYEIQIKVLALRKDLEKNGIKKNMGI